MLKSVRLYTVLQTQTAGALIQVGGGKMAATQLETTGRAEWGRHDRRSAVPAGGRHRIQPRPRDGHAEAVGRISQARAGPTTTCWQQHRLQQEN